MGFFIVRPRLPNISINKNMNNPTANKSGKRTNGHVTHKKHFMRASFNFRGQHSVNGDKFSTSADDEFRLFAVRRRGENIFC